LSRGNLANPHVKLKIPVIKGIGILLCLTVIDLHTQHTTVTPPKGARHVVGYTPSVRLGGGTKVLTVGVVGEGAAPDSIFDCHRLNITHKRVLVKGLVIHTVLTLAPLQHTKGLLGWGREQAGQASAIVALYQ